MENINQKIKNEDKQNLNPLGVEEMNTVIKSFQESSFSGEKLYQNDEKHFLKKSLYELAEESEKNRDEMPEKGIYEEKIEFDNTTENKNIPEEVTSLEQDKTEIENLSNYEKTEQDQINIHEKLDENIVQEDKPNTIDLDQNKEINNDAESNKESEKHIEESNAIIQENKDNEIEKKGDFEEETLDAMDSVREAVVKSLENNDEKTSDETLKSLNDENEKIKNDYDELTKLFNNIKEISIKEIEDNIKDKIYEVSSEIIGYQIDKAPDKYFEKIKKMLSELTKINEEIIIDLSEKDFNLLKKIDKNNVFNKDIKFEKNSDLIRGEFSISAGGLFHSITYSQEKNNLS